MRGLTIRAFTIVLAISFLCSFNGKDALAQSKTSARLSSPSNPPTVSGAGVLIFPAGYPRWFSLGNGPLSLILPNPYPQIAFDRGPWGAMPHGELAYNKSHNKRSLAPSIELGVLVAKIGENGTPFMPFQQRWKYGSSEVNTEYRFDTTDEILIGINDFNYIDNRGAYRFQIADKGNISGARLINTENCYGEQCQTWLVTIVRSDGWFDTGIRIYANQKVKVFGADEAFSIKVGGVSDESIKMGGKSLAFATQEYATEWSGRIGGNPYLAAPDWNDTLLIRINDSYPHTVLRNMKVLLGPTRGM